MFANDADGATGSQELNVETAAPVFEAYLSAEENKGKPETPPAQIAPEPEKTEPAEVVEASTEPAEAEKVESEEPEQTEDEQPESPTEPPALDLSATVKQTINGEEVEITIEEALKGYSRTQDYTRKTQEVAAQRRAFEAEAAAVRERAQQYAAQLAQLEQTITEYTPQEPDWAQVQLDQPAKFPELYTQWAAHKERMAAIREERGRAQEQVMRDQAQLHQQHLQAEQEKLLAALPEWGNPEHATTAKTKMVGYVKDMGYTVAEISQVTDHRLLVLINKAMRWDEAQKKKPDVQQRIEKVRSATPGPASGAVKPVSEAQKARGRLAKTGSQKDAAAAFESFLEED
ncbi:MAG: hypothetical protein H0W74_13450 [Sphingosinicella sp.]|nr:hypothetical protein [Sphingosinicella sp.]